MATALQEIKAVAHDPVAAEKLCAKLGVEFHPIGCDIVTTAAAEEGEVKLCQHVSAVDRKSRQASFDQRVKLAAATQKAESKVAAEAKAEAKEAKAEAKAAKEADAAEK